MEIYDDSTLASICRKPKQSLLFSCCFRRRRRSRSFPLHSPTLIWINSTTKPPSYDQPLSDVKERCCSIIGIAGVKHRRHASVEFSYDPLSYARNFEDGLDFEDDESPLKSFSARLPPSPPPLGDSVNGVMIRYR